MFTINEIQKAHAKVKSGGDFPVYIQDLKKLGVLSYEHYVSDGHINYYGPNNFTQLATAKWEPRAIAAHGNADRLKQALLIHQQGQTDYPTFCKQAAEVGVEKWLVDLQRMTCLYVDKKGGELVVEAIPTA